jgi:hypothetical protein
MGSNGYQEQGLKWEARDLKGAEMGSKGFEGN